MKHIICVFFILGMCSALSNAQTYNLNVTDEYGGDWAEMILYEDTHEITIYSGDVKTPPDVSSILFVVNNDYRFQPIEIQTDLNDDIAFIRLDFTKAIYERGFDNIEQKSIQIFVNGFHIFTFVSD